MLGFNFKFIDETKAVKSAVDRAAIRSMKVAAFAIRRDSIESIQPAPRGVPSAAGSPVHTRTRGIVKSGKRKGQKRLGQVQRAIVYDVDSSAMTAVIGPRASVVGQSMEAHEKGGSYKGTTYAARPTMGPALTKNQTLFGNSFAGSIGS